jgi:GT2 family glycosyltransferase/glycosyltransferase involved in cell wall biosynthesis
VLVDNGSTDDTGALLDRLRNATVLRQTLNEGFGQAVNAGAHIARGRFLLLLNNDAELLPGSLEAAVGTAHELVDVGAVGGRLILPDGSLQEAGAIIWNDGFCSGYGRGATPFAPPYSFRRDVDFCSGAFLLTSRDLFLQSGGFDEAFNPAYYEDADYCVRLWQSGLRVIYEPQAIAIHYEFASAGSARAAKLQLEKRNIFIAKHAGWLATQSAATAENLPVSRHKRRPGQQRVLVFDDRVPHQSMGFGFPRAVQLLRALVELGHFVTLYPLSFTEEEWPSVYEDIPRDIEVMTGSGPEHLDAFMRERRGYYDTIIVSRHHNMQRLRARLGDPERWAGRVVYDAEAVAAMRDAQRAMVSGRAVDGRHADHRLQEEIGLARGTDMVLAVSALELDAFERAGVKRVTIVRYAVQPAPTPRVHAERTGILFVGAFDPLSPNEDAVLWFVQEVLPLIEGQLGAPVPFTIAGHYPPRSIMALASHRIAVLPSAAELAPLYDRARLFVAPTRFAAGIPLKVLHAAAHGLPVVCTSLLARQLGWCDGTAVYAADGAEAFAAACVRLYTNEELWRRVREDALGRLEREYSSSVFTAALADAIGAETGTCHV